MQKIFGLILVILGIAIIGWGLFNTYEIFTAKKEPPKMFTEVVQKQTSALGGTIDAQIQKMIGSQLADVLPTASITKFLDLSAWFLLVWILFLGGGQISSIGVKLLAIEKKTEAKQ